MARAASEDMAQVAVEAEDAINRIAAEDGKSVRRPLIAKRRALLPAPRGSAHELYK